MHQTIFRNQEISYTLKRSARSHRLRIVIALDGSVTVTIPIYLPTARAEQFVREKSAWIQKKITQFKRLQARYKNKEGDGHNSHPPIRLTKVHFKQYKEQARILAESRVRHFTTHYQFPYSRITIRNQKTRWGSCSKRGSLSFNYRIALIPPELADYVIVHELCHLGAMNHSKKFWDLVAQTIPNHKSLRRELRRHGMRYM